MATARVTGGCRKPASWRKSIVMQRVQSIVSQFRFLRYRGAPGLPCSPYRGRRLVPAVLQAFLVAAVLTTLSTSALAAARLALVVGNSDYPQWPLNNPVNDARAISAKLRSLGFDVSTHLQLKRDDIGVVTDTFLRKVTPEDTVVFFFAGHGVQVGGQNFLLATDANIRTEFDVHRNGIDFTRFLKRLERTRAAVKLIFLDACRNNPFAQKLRGGGSREGLARIGGAPYGTLISFATQPGGVAADGNGTHGLYTEQLLTHIDTPGVPVELMLKRVSASTYRESNGLQRPWIEGSLHGDFVFNNRAPAPVAAINRPGAASTAREPVGYAQLAWTYALDANTEAGYRAFLKEYPASPYSALARIKLATLEQASASRAVNTAPAAPPKLAKRVTASKPAVAATAGNATAVNAVATAPAAPQAVRPSAPTSTAQVASIDSRLSGRTTRPDVSVTDDAGWDLAALDGKQLVAAQDAPFEARFTVRGNRLVVDFLKWKELPPDSEGADNDPLRCGFFSSALSVSSAGGVSGSCSAGHITVRVRGTIRQLEISGSYLARGGVSETPPMTVPLARR